MNKALKYVLLFIGCYIVMFIGYPFVNGVIDPLPYTKPFYWLNILIAECIVCLPIVYFTEINPRRFVFIIKTARCAVLLTVATLFLIGSIIGIAFLESVALKAFLIVTVMLVFLFMIYLALHRGIAFYKSRKIRIFDGKIQTYTSPIEEFSYQNGMITLLIDGKEHSIKASQAVAQGAIPEIRFYQQHGYVSEYEQD